MRIIFTRHARQRMKKRKVTESQAHETLSNPDEIESGDNDEDIAIRQYGQREVRVVYNEIEEDVYLIYTVIKPRVKRQ